MLAVIETGGKQYKVAEGDVLRVEKLGLDDSSDVILDKVLLISDNDGQVKIGQPYLEGAKVSAKSEKEGRADKIVVVKYKAKVRYHKKAGHRQPYSQIKIQKIG